MNNLKVLFLLFSVLCFGCKAFAQEEPVCIDGIYYNLNSEEKTAEVTRKTFFNGYKEDVIVIPSSIRYSNEKYTVTGIASNTFNSCDSLRSITLPKTITRIGDGAFSWCRNLTSIIIPKSVISIGDGAFTYCDSLKSITIPKSVNQIGIETFNRSGLEEIKVNKRNKAYISVDGILYTKDMSALIKYPEAKESNEFIIPSSVTNIGDYAFYGAKLKFITLPSSVTHIGIRSLSPYGSFKIKVDKANKTYTTVDGSLYTKDMSTLIKYRKSYKQKRISIPNSVTHIADYAFEGCHMDSLVLPSSVNSIGTGAFLFCSMTSIVLPNSVTSIGDGAFEWCDRLDSICIPNSVTHMGNSAFKQCFKLRAIKLSNSINSIGDGVFNNCHNLTSITIPNSVTSIGNGAFDGCENLTSLTISNSVTSIGNVAFGRCESLTSLTIPNSVTNIGYSAFLGCKNLTSLYLDNTNDFTRAPSIGNDNKNCVLYVPSQLKEKYENSICKRFFSKIVGMDFDKASESDRSTSVRQLAK